MGAKPDKPFAGTIATRDPMFHKELRLWAVDDGYNSTEDLLKEKLGWDEIDNQFKTRRNKHGN